MNFIEEVGEIILCYLSDDESFDFLNEINAKKREINQKNKLLIHSEIDLQINNLSLIKKYKTTILNSRSIDFFDSNEKAIRIKSDINDWAFNLNLFDNIINVLNLHQIENLEKFLQICFFALREGGKLSFIIHSRNNFHNLAKKLIELDSKLNNQKIIQRFNFSNNFEKIESLLQFYKFKNITVIKENVNLYFKNINDFLLDKNFPLFFTKDHFANLNYIRDNLKNESYEEELEIFIIKCSKNRF
jgi:SAM-dependent methyltransferase